ncbi:MAG TPA: glycosyltransferase family 4 protein [Candidatus Latescibacteria bacterium]|nr:glycosyltransferase family 4 protein [Candidatus Latescibacterota bacterium]
MNARNGGGIAVDMVVYNDLRHDARVFKEATSLIAAGYDVRVIGMETPRTAPLIGWEEVPFERLPVGTSDSLRIRYACFWRRAFGALMKRRARIIHAHDLDTLFPAWLAASLTRALLVHDAHELWVELPSLVGRPVVRAAWQGFAKTLIPRCDAVITVCEGIAEELRSRYGASAVVLRNLPKKIGPVEPAPIREMTGCPLSRVLVLYQGGFLPGLGIERAIDAMTFLPDAHLVLIGAGPLRETMERRAAASPARERISFLDAVPFRDLPPYTAACDVGLFLGESAGLNLQLALPNKLFEYIAAGVPVVATGWPEIRRVVREYDVGVLVEPGCDLEAVANAIRTAASHRERLSANCVKAARELTWERESGRLLEVYARLSARNSSPENTNDG